MMQALLFPALLLVMLNAVLGKQVSSFAGADAPSTARFRWSRWSA